MKKNLIFLLMLAFGVLGANAQLKYKTGSFHHTNESDVVAAGTDLGRKNMSSSLADFAGTHNDSDIKSGIIRVRFSNLSNEDVENHMSASVNPSYVNKTEYRQNTSGALEYWVHVDPDNDLTLTLSIDGIGSVRIPHLKIESGNMYALDVESDEMVPVTFSSNVDGTEIWFDGKPLGGRTAPGINITKDKTYMGTHKIKAIAGGVTKEFDIEVSKKNTHFPIDMLRRFKVEFLSNEAGVGLYEGNKPLGTMPMTIEVTEGPHSYTVKKYGYDNVDYNENITGNCTKTFNIHKSKTIDFYAISNNTDYKGASVYIDNELKGDTPLQLTLPYGRYRVRMSTYDREKSAKLTVDENTSSRFLLKLPAKHRRFNPFNIDYKKREAGFTVAYVQKWMYISDGHNSIGTNYFAEEKHMSGFQVGVPIQPIFGYGMGLNTGLFYEAYFAGYEDYSENINMVEHNLYMPVDFMFRLPLGENFSIYVCGGIGIDWSLSTVLTSEGYDDYNIDYGEEGAQNRFNFSGEFGGGIQFKAVQLSANYQIGLNNNSKMVSDDVTAKLRKFSIQFSFLF